MRHEGVTSFKMFMAYPGNDDGGRCGDLPHAAPGGADGGMIALHAENGTVIELLIQEALAAGHTSPRYHATDATRDPGGRGDPPRHPPGRTCRSADLFRACLLGAGVAAHRERPRRGHPVFAETCPHYLLFDDTVYASDDFEIAKYVMTPPLRTPRDQQHLWRALRFDDLQVIATDHCPFCMKEGIWATGSRKMRGKDDFSKIPNGAPGIETRMVSLFDIGVMQGGCR
jgi:dihydropyrimidinase